jgi:hypothetical protein
MAKLKKIALTLGEKKKHCNLQTRSPCHVMVKKSQAKYQSSPIFNM